MGRDLLRVLDYTTTRQTGGDRGARPASCKRMLTTSIARDKFPMLATAGAQSGATASVNCLAYGLKSRPLSWPAAFRDL